MSLGDLIFSFVALFEESAGSEGKNHTIKLPAFRAMVEEQLESPQLKDKIHPDDVKEALEMLDKNYDGEVNFREFARCTAALAKGAYKHKRGRGGKKGKGKEESQGD